MAVSSVCFPYGESIRWFAPDEIGLPAPALTDWLLDSTSLTLRLKRQCQTFEVRVLGEALLKLPSHAEAVWIREVLLVLDNTPWVFARTLVPESLLSHLGTELTALGNRPLGELLFASGYFRPGRIEVAGFDACSTLASLAHSLGQNVQETLWGRRRYFGLATDTSLNGNNTLTHHAQKALSACQTELTVSEIFLPAAMQHILGKPAALPNTAKIIKSKISASPATATSD